MQRFHSLLIAVAIFSLSACLEFHEIIQLKADGSAQMTLQIKVPQLPKKPGESTDKDPSKEATDLVEGLTGGMHLEKNEKTEINGITVFRAVVSLDSLNDVRTLYQKVHLKESDPKKQEEKKGKDEFEQLFSKSNHFVVSSKGDTLNITRSFTPPKAAKPKPEPKEADKDKFSKEFEDAILNTFYFTFEFVPPAEAMSNNATLVVADTYRWETCLGYLLKNPFKMEIQIPNTPELKARYGKK